MKRQKQSQWWVAGMPTAPPVVAKSAPAIEAMYLAPAEGTNANSYMMYSNDNPKSWMGRDYFKATPLFYLLQCISAEAQTGDQIECTVRNEAPYRFFVYVEMAGGDSRALDEELFKGYMEQKTKKQNYAADMVNAFSRIALGSQSEEDGTWKWDEWVRVSLGMCAKRLLA